MSFPYDYDWVVKIGKKEFTNIYISLEREDDTFIDNLRIEKMKSDKKHYTKTEIARYLINLGMDVETGKYLKLDPSLDSFISQLQNMVIEMDGQKITIKKSKEQVYTMLIQKGLQHLND